MSQTVEVRLAEDWERPSLAELIVSVYRQFATGDGDESFWEHHRQSTRQTVIHDESVVPILASCDGQTAGAVIVCPPYETRFGEKLVKNIYPEMRLLAVSPKFRNLGIAGKLVDRCEQIAIEQGFDTLSLHTTRLMAAAMAMYQRRGYERFCEIDFEAGPGLVVEGFKRRLQGLPA